MSRYTLAIVRHQGPVGQPLPVPPEIVDLTGPHPRGGPHQEWYNAWWERPEDVPLPVTWPEKEISFSRNPATEKYQLVYRVARIPERKSILDYIPPESDVRLRLGGKNVRQFIECKAADAMEALRGLLVDMVKEWGGGPNGTAGYCCDPGWEFLEQNLMWIELPNNLRVKWTPWGDSDEGGGHSLEPAFGGDFILSAEEVEWDEVDADSPMTSALDHARNAAAYYTQMASRIEEFFALFPKPTEGP